MGRRKDASDDERDLREAEDRLNGARDADDVCDVDGWDTDEARGESDAGDESGCVDFGPGERWDPGDERRRKDCFAPPQEPCECYCLHCGRTFMSDQIWFQRVIGDPMGLEGFWMCPTSNCGGAGFTFDIFPTDPAHPANDGWSYSDDEEDEEEVEFDDDDDDPDASWDSQESKYKELDEVFGDDADFDIEGEEWKYGLAPGERPESDWMEAARREREEEERRYDEPDQRPRTLDWTNREDRKPSQRPGTDDDIPF